MRKRMRLHRVYIAGLTKYGECESVIFHRVRILRMCMIRGELAGVTHPPDSRVIPPVTIRPLSCTLTPPVTNKPPMTLKPPAKKK